MHTSMKRMPLSIDKAIKINDGKDKKDMNFKTSKGANNRFIFLWTWLEHIA